MRRPSGHRQARSSITIRRAALAGLKSAPKASARETFLKLDEAGAVAFAKRISSGEIESPISKSEMLAIIDVNAGLKFPNRNRVISDSDDAAHLSEALALESGHDTARPGKEEGTADNELRARAARRHGADPSRSYERHTSDILGEDKDLAARVLAEERNKARKRLAAAAA